MSRLVALCLLVLLTTPASLGCSSSVNSPSGPAVVINPATCEGRLETVLTFSERWVTSFTVAPDGTILYSTFDGIFARSPGESPAHLISSQLRQADKMWIRGDALLVAWDGGLYTLPVAGGQASFLSGVSGSGNVLSPDPSADLTAVASKQGYAIDDTNVYVMVGDILSGFGVWSLPITATRSTRWTARGLRLRSAAWTQLPASQPRPSRTVRVRTSRSSQGGSLVSAWPSLAFRGALSNRRRRHARAPSTHRTTSRRFPPRWTQRSTRTMCTRLPRSTWPPTPILPSFGHRGDLPRSLAPHGNAQVRVSAPPSSEQVHGGSSGCTQAQLTVGVHAQGNGWQPLCGRIRPPAMMPQYSEPA